jgi:hypothetical protein
LSADLAGTEILGATLVDRRRSTEAFDVWRATSPERGEVAVYLATSPVDSEQAAFFKEAATKLTWLVQDPPLPGIGAALEVSADGRALVASAPGWTSLDSMPELGWKFEHRYAVIDGVGRALAGLHALGSAHGCLLPGNVLLSEQGAPVLMEIGLIEPSVLAGDGLTNAFVAPELLDGGAPSVASDVYAFGHLLLWTLFDAAPEPVADDVPDLSSVAAIAPEGIVRIARKCLCANPTMRYASVEELLGELARFGETNSVGLAAPDRTSATDGPRDSKRPSYDELRAMRAKRLLQRGGRTSSTSMPAVNVPDPAAALLELESLPPAIPPMVEPSPPSSSLLPADAAAPPSSAVGPSIYQDIADKSVERAKAAEEAATKKSKTRVVVLLCLIGALIYPLVRTIDPVSTFVLDFDDSARSYGAVAFEGSDASIDSAPGGSGKAAKITKRANGATSAGAFLSTEAAPFDTIPPQIVSPPGVKVTLRVRTSTPDTKIKVVLGAFDPDAPALSAEATLGGAADAWHTLKLDLTPEKGKTFDRPSALDQLSVVATFPANKGDQTIFVDDISIE